jgi:ATP-dependent DNA ligase
MYHNLIELNGDDLRREVLINRKATLVIALVGVRDGFVLNDHMEHDNAALVFQRACKLGFEGIISKRKDLPYRSVRSPDWIKLKNLKAPAVKREAERTGADILSAPVGTSPTKCFTNELMK